MRRFYEGALGLAAWAGAWRFSARCLSLLECGNGWCSPACCLLVMRAGHVQPSARLLCCCLIPTLPTPSASPVLLQSCQHFSPALARAGTLDWTLAARLQAHCHCATVSLLTLGALRSGRS
ncbi:hypothetical protein Zm00014a_005551 [Zea mays]|uniref:Uncharacterized protein n=1 Tax=Zea mays TaxID=4577 RepID=A0A317Y1J1_MAIZE|nr:hypothetical protein Zm00014a_005551 [Zea mays]